MQALEPDLIVHTAAIADIDACEANPELAWSTNSLGTRYVAKAARTTGSRLIHLSTSNVFDGQKGDYSESDPTHGVNVYSRTKIASEQEVLKFEGCVVVRTSLVLGFPKPAGRSFLARAVLALRQGRSLLLPDDEIRSPIDSWTLASCILELGSQGEAGIYHIAGTERLSRYEMGLKIAHRIAADHSLVVPLQEICPDRAPRPADASLNTSKARNLLKTDLPDCGQAIDRAFRWADVGI